MPESGDIINLLEEKGLPLAGEIVQNPSTPSGFFVPLRLTRQTDGKKLPSGKTLALARDSLLALGYTIDFILIDEESWQIEESLRASLLSSFPNDIRNSFFSPNTEHPQAWIEFKRPLDNATILRLEEHLRKFASLFALPSLTMTRLGETDTATKIEILSAVRMLTPVDLSALREWLIGQGLSVPSTDWLNRRLDVLRKSGLVLRRHDKMYVLTAKALAQLGTSINRQSPDVRLFLALARRGS